MSANYAEVAANTPVLVGVGIASQKCDDPSQAKEAVALMEEAVRSAAADAGASEALSQVQRIGVPKGIWSYADAGRLLANAIGAESATTVMAEIGILQQSLMGDACQRIAEGELDMALVVGGEAKHRGLRSQITGIEISETEQSEDADVVMHPESEIWSQVESDAGLGMPVGYYAIMESALRHDQGLSLDAHRDKLAAMYEGFADTAKANPHAWVQTGMSAEAIRNPSPKNKMLAFPYTKYHNTQWNVDQAGALLFCSAAKARELGVPESQWVFPLASTESNFMVNMAQRQELHGCPGSKLAGEKALEIAGMGANDFDYLDMYSCFPSAVQIYARDLGIDLEGRELTVTGGMTFGGGPLNNYVIQSTAKMALRLRENPGTTGLVTSVSGMLTKQGFGVWASKPGVRDFEYADITEAVKAQWQPLPIAAPEVGEATIVGYTVVYAGENPERLIAVVNLASGPRSVVYSQDAELMQVAVSEELVGRKLSILGEGQLALA